MKDFAALFREARRESNITLRTVGAYVQKSFSYLSDIEHRRRRAPDVLIAQQIEECLGITDGRLVMAALKERQIIPNHVLLAKIGELEKRIAALEARGKNICSKQ